jgi:hypothetical protein
MTPERIRELSRAAGPDILADAPPAHDARWLYAPGDFAAATIARLVREGFAANRNVHYATNFAAPRTGVRFTAAPAGERVEFVTHGSAHIEVDGVAIGSQAGAAPADGAPDPSVARRGHSPGETQARRVVAVPAGSREIAITVSAEPDEAASIAVISGPAAWLADGEPADERDGTLAAAPHETGEPLQRVALSYDGELYDTGVPVLGRPVIECDAEPVVRTGESRAEALSEDAHESRHDVVRRDDGRWTTRHPLGFRYLHFDHMPVKAYVEAQVRPAPRRGAFASSDPRLDRIWATSAYTLRASMQRLTIDGIKRDRMPWVGDQALALLSNAFAFGDPRILVDGLEALGRPAEGYANGISDYSLWWIVAARLLGRFHGVASPRLTDTAAAIMRGLAEMCDDEGVFRPRSFESDFADSSAGAIFIDWGMSVDEGAMPTALQMLWHWALRSISELTGEAHWDGLADRIRETLIARAWDPERRRWNKNLDGRPIACSYADAFAVLGDVARGADTYSSGYTLDDARAMGTPFMAGFGLLALAEVGGSTDVVAGVRERWQPMLDLGATAFWEEGVTDASPWEMYGRSFGKSLCHGWASAPAFLLPLTVLGIEPLADGWREVRVRPRLGALEWAAAVVPTPLGDLTVEAGAAGVRIDAPDGMTIRR